MKFSLFIDKNREEEVMVYAHEKSPLTDEIESIVQGTSKEIIGYIERESVVLDLMSISCFSVENNKVYALTNDRKYSVRYRLYQLEEILPQCFVKINQSCVANIKQIARFDSSVGGSLLVIFNNGHADYVSRRQLKSVKERFGL